jgi:hypothetical protein
MSPTASSGAPPPNNLDSALQALAPPADWPVPLPIVHVTVARWFNSIVDQGRLEPRLCSVFGERLVYLFYGGAFYRTADTLTKDASELPIAFLFEPNVLAKISRFYPFDTGALASGHFGAPGDRFKPFMSAFQIPGVDAQTPSRVVHHLFGSNKNYISGSVDPDCRTKPSPLPELYELMTQDLTSSGTDHRQCCIECQTTNTLDLGEHLAWLAFPESQFMYFQKLYRKKTAPRMPQYYAYSSHVIINPREITYDIHQHALEFIEPYLKGV